MINNWKLLCINLFGVIYIFFVIAGIVCLNLLYICPELYNKISCSWASLYNLIIMLQLLINFVLFHYFNQRNQVSHWRIKSSLFLHNFIPEKMQFSNKENCDSNFTVVDILPNNLYNDINNANYLCSNNELSKSKPDKSLEPLSILEKNLVVKRIPDDYERYQLQKDSNRLFAYFDGIYRNNEEILLLNSLCNSENDSLKNNLKLVKNETKWCNKCSTLTPKRCHHCPLCNMCILRKDHHCFITGGCVGLANQRFFIVFLFWASIGSFYGLTFFFLYLNKFVANWYPFGWVYYLGPVALVRWIVLSTETFFNFCLTIMFNISVGSFLSATAFLFAQMFYTLNGYTMHDYHVNRLKEKLEGDGETFSERLALVFGRRWWINFFVPQFWLPNEITPAIAQNIFVSISKDL